MSLKRMTRYAMEDGKKLESGDVPLNPKGLWFEGPNGVIDHWGVNVVGATVDTVRQLYSGLLKPESLEKIQKCVENRETVLKDCPFSPLYVGKMGKSSGYTYRLQNNERGVVILVKSQYKAVDVVGTHVKIEFSPHLIQNSDPLGIFGNSMWVAEWLLDSPQPAGVHVHMAVDLQGWGPSKDFEDRFVTRSRAVRRFSGLSSFEFDLAESAAIYGDRETFMFGKAASLQACIYRKDLEIVKRDKVDYFHALWGELSSGCFDPELPVWRVELRFHHGVIKEIGNGLDKEFLDFFSVSKYLTDIWQYGLNRNRLMYDKQYLDPIWQILDEDCRFYVPARKINIKRLKKKGGESIVRNVAIILGNLISLYARHNASVDKVIDDLRQMAVYKDIVETYRARGKYESDIWDDVASGLQKRRLIGKAA